MHSDQTYRAFLLRMTDAVTEDAIEVEILNGGVDSLYLCQLEDELIDDYIFERLSVEEREHFKSEFLTSPQRAYKLRLAAALRAYAVQHSPQREPSSWLQGLKKVTSIRRNIALSAALACALIVVVWLADRNHRLRDELALSKADDNAARHEIASLRREEREQPATIPAAPSEPSLIPGIQLSSGASRGLTAVPVLHLGKQAVAATIKFELPFDPHGKLEVALLNAEGQIMWSQRFSDSNSVASRGVTTVVLPVAVLAAGDYRLRVEAGNTEAEAHSAVTPVFRVRKD